MTPESPETAGNARAIVEVEPGARAAYLPLLELADDSPTEIARYREQGTLYGLLDGPCGPPCGLVLAAATDEPRTARLLSVAIVEPRQGQGLGRWLVAEVLARLRARGFVRVMVSTASSSVGVLAFYQRLGFRMLRIERDALGPARGYPADLREHGIPVRDLVWLDRAL